MSEAKQDNNPDQTFFCRNCEKINIKKGTVINNTVKTFKGMCFSAKKIIIGSGIKVNPLITGI